ncbi:MAG TPA: NADH-quinone oxidoreductase subunit NuoE [Terriglobales bacterium]|nr:NADH-quinone oxidoreductase subunit NuoE [Terriglobales bacterium]
MITKETEEKIRSLKGKYPKIKTCVLPVFHILYQEKGCVDKEGIQKVSELLGIPLLELYEVLSFYVFFPAGKVGKYWIRVCDNLSCSLLGAESIIKYLEEKLKIRVGQTTPDGLFTLSTEECLGSCGTAPMMMVNEEFHENLTREKIDKLIEELSKR